MKVALIAMSGVRVRSAELAALGVTLPGFVERGRVIASMPSLALLTLAALTDDEVEYFEVADLDGAVLPDGFDLVAISTCTAQIGEAYALADRYRARGVPVVLGGLHVSQLPEEAALHADAVVVGEGEEVWPEVLRDARAGRLRPLYRAPRPFDLRLAPVPRYDLLDFSRYNRIPVQTHRGCPMACEFCGASRLLGGGFRQKSVEQVLREIDAVARRWPHPFIELADDNTFVNKRWGREFVHALAPYRLKWFTETDISAADDDALLDGIAASGCRMLLIGLESPTAGSLDGLDAHNWKHRRFTRYAEAIRRIQSRGIAVNGCFIVGLDGDDASVFERVARFAQRTGLADVQVTVPTPLPGTRLYARLRGEGRLLDDRPWDRCTLFDVTFTPKGMTVRELEEGFAGLLRTLYTQDAVAARRRQFFGQVRAA